MPNYITAMLLKPQRLHLFHTGEQQVAKRLCAALKADISLTPDIVFHKVNSSSSPTEIESAFETAQVPDTAHLSFTGGTKAMSVFFHKAWQRKAGDGGRSSYLDGARDTLVFSDGTEREIKDVNLTIKRITQLHGIRRVSKSDYRSTDPPTDDDAVAMLGIALDKSGGIERIKGIHSAVSALVTSREVRSGGYEYRLESGNLQFPDELDGIIKRRCVCRQETELVHDWAGFLLGHWLEHAMDCFVRRSGCATESVRSLAGLRPGRRRFEVDVMATRGHRSFVISCKANGKKKEAKLASFEVAVRGPQIGGDLTRTAIVALIDNETVMNLQRDHEAVWGKDATKTKVFGLEDLRAWARGDFDTLKRWAG